MAYDFPNNPSPDDLTPDGLWRWDGSQWNPATIVAAQEVRGARVRRTSSFSASPGVSNLVPWDTADYQRGGTWWSAGDPTKLVVPPGVNKVRIRGSAQFNPAGGTASFNITVMSDVANIPGFRQISQVPGGFSWSGAGASGEIDVVPGNYFQFSVYQNTAGNLALAETEYTWFEIEAIEDYSASIPGSTDDYEEGMWTPVVEDAKDGGNTAAGITVTAGWYTKIGRQVTVTVDVVTLDTTGLTAGNQLWINGLPFANGTDAPRGAGAVQLAQIAFTGQVAAEIQQAAFGMRLKDSVSGGASAAILVSAVTSGAGQIRATYTYFTD